MGWVGKGVPFLPGAPAAPSPARPPRSAPEPSSTFCRAAFFTPSGWVGGSHKPSPQPGGGPRGPSLCCQDELQLRGAPSCLGAAGCPHNSGPPSLTPSCLAPGHRRPPAPVTASLSIPPTGPSLPRSCPSGFLGAPDSSRSFWT